MWSRKDIKLRAKEKFKLNYWKSVLVALILTIVIGGFSSGSSAGSSIGSSFNYYDNSFRPDSLVVEESDEAEDVISEMIDDFEDAAQNDEDMADEADDFIIGTSDGEEIPTAAIVAFGVVMAIIFVVIFALALVFDAFIMNPFELGCRRFFERNLEEPAGLSSVVYAFDHSYKNIVKTMFIRDLQVALWSLLFVIPGIVASYSLYH